MHDIQGSEPRVYDASMGWERVVHGPGALERLAAEAERLGMSAALVMTSRSLADRGALVARIKRALGTRLAGVWTDCRQHVPRSSIRICTEQARSLGCDGIVSLGGGSVIDAAKGVVLSLCADGATDADFNRYKIDFDHDIRSGGPAMTAPLVPHIALPTTLSGAEFSSLIGILNESTGRKDLYLQARLAPTTVLLDPALASETPWPLWAATGTKILSDAIEQLYSVNRHPVLDPMLVRAIEWMITYLPRGRAADQESVLKCQLACWMTMFGVFATDTRVGIGAGLRHQLGALCDVAHGTASAVLLPHVLRFNLPSAPDAAAILARSLGLDDRPTELLSEEVAKAIAEFVASLALPTTLTELGVPATALNEIAANALRDSVIRGNPRPIPDREQVMEILLAAR